MRRLLNLDGRVLAAAAVIVFFAVLLSFRAVNGTTPWAHVGVAPGAVSFLDLRSVTSSWECEHKGVEAFPDNPCDPFHRPANYPRLWTRFGAVGLGPGDTVPLGVAIAVVFFLAALAVTGPLTFGEGAVYGAALLAPASMLGVERGNVDLLMFALVAVGVLLIRRSPWAGAVPIVLAGVLKLFPATALAALVRKRNRWPAAVGSVVVLGAYGIATFHDIRTLRHAIPRQVIDSYGAGVVADVLADSPSGVREVRIAVIVVGLLLALGLRLLRGGANGNDGGLRLDVFWAGAGIYLASYVFGSNFDYRLAFLLLCVPQLCEWARNGGSPAPWPAAALASLVATLWLSSAQPPLPFGLQTWYLKLSFPPDEVLNWLLFAWLAAALLVAPQFRHRTATKGVRSAP
ncbi:MAG TPA: glycosyltransferase family 87 protein [Gaiellaceae bacterium]|nr:glycosyltransferase family 87 protein [Gaiellaceae bacterium]